MSKLNFELVVPAYNEARNLQSLIEATSVAAKHSGFSSEQFKLVVVNNGSKDNSNEVLASLAKTDLGPWFRVVDVQVNQGYGFGLWSGLKTTTAEYVGWSHADLQCDPVSAFKALNIVTQPGNEKVLVKGVRSGRNWKDICVSRVFETVALVVLGLKIYEINAQPKVFHKALLGFVKEPPKTFAFDLYVLYCAAKNGFKFQTVDVLFPPRIHGVSNWASSFLGRYKTIWGMIKYMFHLAKTEGRI